MSRGLTDLEENEGQLSFSLNNDEEIVAAMVALNEASEMPAFNLESDMPPNIDFDEHIKEIASDVDVVYIMKVQFTEEM